MSNMPSSPRGLVIEAMTGDPSEILTLAQQMMDLGWDMQDAAATLQAVSDSQADMHGQSIEALRSRVKNLDSFLSVAGEEYAAKGLAFRNYGSEISELKPQIQAQYDDACAKWDTFLALPGERERTDYSSYTDEAAEKARRDDEAKRAAYEDWEQAATLWDESYSQWRDAYATADRALAEAFSGELRDQPEDVLDWEFQKYNDLLSAAGAVMTGAGFLGNLGPLGKLVELGIAADQIRVQSYLALRGKGEWEDVGETALSTFLSLTKTGEVASYGMPLAQEQSVEANRKLTDEAAANYRASSGRATIAEGVGPQAGLSNGDLVLDKRFIPSVDHGSPGRTDVAPPTYSRPDPSPHHSEQGAPGKHRPGDPNYTSTTNSGPASANPTGSPNPSTHYEHRDHSPDSAYRGR